MEEFEILVRCVYCALLDQKWDKTVAKQNDSYSFHLRFLWSIL